MDFDADFADFHVDLDADFDVDFAVFDADFVVFNVDFTDFVDFALKLVKLTVSFHSTVRIQGRNINFLFENLQNLQIFRKSAVFDKIHGFS